jgi:sugar transferase (PEP-CTERM system associated)
MRLRVLVTGFLRALGAAAGVLWILARLVPHAVLGQGSPALALAGAAVILPAWRAAYQLVSTSDSFRRPVVILGGGPLARECARLVREDHALGLRLAGVLLAEGEAAPRDVPVLGGYADLRRVQRERRIGVVLVASPDRRGALPMDELLDLKLRGVDVEEGVAFYERVLAKIFVPGLEPSDVVFSPGFHARASTLALKRAIDVALAAALLLPSLPVMAIAAIAVKLDSPGPALYSQIRAGALGRAFRIYKLRSMRTDAEAGGARWAAENDPRVTRVGAVIRSMRIDELPQLWNVLVGDMSLVGPRPERPVFVEQLEREIPFFRQRLGVKPGVTGHAQVRSRYGASAEDALEKLEYDLFYIKRLSIWFDLSILLDTVKVVLLRIGSR